MTDTDHVLQKLQLSALVAVRTLAAASTVFETKGASDAINTAVSRCIAFLEQATLVHDTIVSLSEETRIESGRYPQRLATEDDLYAALSPTADTIVTVTEYDEEQYEDPSIAQLETQVADFRRRLDSSVKNVEDRIRDLIRVPDVMTDSVGIAAQGVREAMNDSDLQSAMAAISADSSKTMVEKMAAIWALTENYGGLPSMKETYTSAQKKENREQNGLKLTGLLDKGSHAGHRTEIAKLIGSRAQGGTTLSYPWVILQSIDNSNIPGRESLVRDSVLDD